MSSARYFYRIPPQGNAAGPVVIILLALAISAGVFFLFTKKRMDADRKATTVPAVPVQVIPPEAPPSPLPQTGMAATEEPVTSKPLGFARAQDLAEQLARHLAAGDVKAAAGLIAAGDPSQEPMALGVMERLKAMGIRSGPVEMVETLGQVDGALRLSVPLMLADGSTPAGSLQIDVVRDPAMGWRISRLRLPKELESAVAAAMPAGAPMINPNGGPPLPGGMSQSIIVVDAGPDALSQANRFVRALVSLNYEEARKYVDEKKVPPVKLAGLCIVFEEGKYQVDETKPLTATVSTENSSWIIAKVNSERFNETTEFGLEMEKLASGWRIIGLNLSRLLADNARSSSLVGIPYTPLVQNPKGGESIALYFEYDQAELHPRAKAQLSIVADILKSSPTKKLKIGGHTDAKGSDDYNVALSQKRAKAVKEFFVEVGVPIAQVETVGFGKDLPLSPNLNPDGSDNPEGRSRNRRAEILLDF
jgi:outer membrane protein OmpA-like peptidoglycan-associated protein